MRYFGMSTRSFGPASPGPAFLFTLVAITLVGTMSIHLFLPLLPDVKQSFDASDAMVGATFSLALFVMAFSTLAYGSLSDRYGRRPVLMAGLALFCAGALVSALAPSIEVLLAGRLIQGLGAGCGVTIARAIARDRYGTDSLVTVIAYLTMASTLGPTFSPLISGLLVDSLGWRSVLWFSVAAGGLILAAAHRVLPESRPTEDLAAQSPGFLRNYGTLLKNPSFLGFVLATGFSSGTFVGVAAAISFLLKDYLGRSATEFGLYFTLFPSAYALGSYLGVRLAARTSIEASVLIGALLMALMVAGQAVVMIAGYVTPLILVIPWSLISIAQGLITPNAQAGAIRVKPQLSGTASGIAMFCHFALGAVFVQIYTAIADGTPMPMVIIMSVGTALTLAFACLPALMKRRRA